MTDQHIQLLEAAKALLPYLEASTDHRDSLIAISESGKEDLKRLNEEFKARERISPADRLRQQADEIEAKDAVIKRFRAAVAAQETAE
jgi:DNA-binding PadR family transcriptional regulator